MNSQIATESPMIAGLGFYKNYENQNVISWRQETQGLSFEELIAKRQLAAQ